ncbi:acyl-CoA dehydrogenase family protein [Streptomyces sp. ITFR-16]|uniref:acyl-CoA dehydrogenase family protein n=1 Tax=Streptomyces sp. ITFR-16 TaxID=3075198 RepID=UPI002889CC7D|nr:acyl-CoA dehydrogenase family protein [Streptomyces sp. ITFR-16]WNI26309.1 acyl-CoA dehydrogenase family protein [Streptomyces sp. ITFR-16]
MPADRVLPSHEAVQLLGAVRAFAQESLAPRAAAAEAGASFPRDAFRALGDLGMLGLPYPEEHGGGGRPYEVYLQALEEVATAWASVGVGVSVHVMACFPLARFGTQEQRRRWLPRMLGGRTLGAYCLSEPEAGSDPAAMRTRAVLDGDHYVINGLKAWTTHGGHADFYTVMARTSDHRSHGISCFLVPADTPGLTADPPERKMGLTGSATTSMRFEDVRIPVARRIGEEGQGLKIALAALDNGRMGIAAVAVGLAQAALDAAVGHACRREVYGAPLIEQQGPAFALADMAAAVTSARTATLAAARLKDQGLPFGRDASIAKMLATDNAMRVTGDAVELMGDEGYSAGGPAERYMREAKVMQIFEGTNQIQRLVISRALRSAGAGVMSTPSAVTTGGAEH